MKHTRQLLCLLLALLLTVSVFAAFAATGTVKPNTGRRHVTCTALSAQAEAYYTGDYAYRKLSLLKGVDAPKDSWAATQNNPLYTALQTLMSDTQKNSVSYQSLPNYWRNTDTQPGAKGYMFFYGDVDDSLGYTMNREHIWCKSKASFFQLGGGCDLHHLRPSIDFINEAKNYYVFGEVKGKYSDAKTREINGENVYWVSPNRGIFEVKDDVKGDVARILLYVYCRWGQPNLYSDVSHSKLPPLDSDDNLNYGEKVIENRDVLLQWMIDDPVDEWEMGRNDQVENVQGNRNVFIDYPELAWLMFGLEVPSDMDTPSGIAKTGLPCPTADYTDVPAETNWAHAGIDYVVERGIMGSTRTDALTFEPNTACTRAMIVSMLYRLEGEPAVSFEGRFSDVAPGQWYSKAVIWAYRNGIVSGYNNGNFGPNDLVTREQLAVILKAYAEYCGITTKERANISEFPDESKATWSRDAVRWAVAVGLISGKSNAGTTLLDPQGKATRAEVASILMRFMQNILDY